MVIATSIKKDIQTVSKSIKQNSHTMHSEFSISFKLISTGQICKFVVNQNLGECVLSSLLLQGLTILSTLKCQVMVQVSANNSDISSRKICEYNLQASTTILILYAVWTQKVEIHIARKLQTYFQINLLLLYY